MRGLSLVYQQVALQHTFSVSLPCASSGLFEKQHSPPSFTSARGVSGALIITACASRVPGVLLLLVTLLSPASPLGALEQHRPPLCSRSHSPAPPPLWEFKVTGATPARGTRVVVLLLLSRSPWPWALRHRGQSHVCLFPSDSKSLGFGDPALRPEGQDRGPARTVSSTFQSTHLQMHRCVASSASWCVGQSHFHSTGCRWKRRDEGSVFSHCEANLCF